MLWLAESSWDPMLMWIQPWALLRKSLASCCTSLGQVADHMRTCLSGRICSKIFLIWGSKPMSSILSASSRTRYVVLLRFILPASKKSIRRPGVAIQISAPFSMSLS